MFAIRQRPRATVDLPAEQELIDTPCKACYPLSAAACGECVRLVGIEGGRRLRHRLAELGLNPGSVVRVVRRQPGGPLILAVKGDARMAIGRGMAHKIIVAPLESD